MFWLGVCIILAMIFVFAVGFIFSMFVIMVMVMVMVMGMTVVMRVVMSLFSIMRFSNRRFRQVVVDVTLSCGHLKTPRVLVGLRAADSIQLQ